METIEYEERVMISEDDYKQVINDIKRDGKPFTSLYIENIYLDNDSSFIYKTKKMLRMRTINQKEKELTLKIKNSDGSTREINETMNNHPIIDKELEGSFSTYKEIAKLITERIEVQYDDYLLVIDKNIYHNVIDYDLEIESSSQEYSLEKIKEYCQKYNLKYDSHYQTKSHRAISKALNK